MLYWHAECCIGNLAVIFLFEVRRDIAKKLETIIETLVFPQKLSSSKHFAVNFDNPAEFFFKFAICSSLNVQR